MKIPPLQHTHTHTHGRMSFTRSGSICFFSAVPVVAKLLRIVRGTQTQSHTRTHTQTYTHTHSLAHTRLGKTFSSALCSCCCFLPTYFLRFFFLPRCGAQRKWRCTVQKKTIKTSVLIFTSLSLHTGKSQRRNTLLRTHLWCQWSSSSTRGWPLLNHNFLSRGNENESEHNRAR